MVQKSVDLYCKTMREIGVNYILLSSSPTSLASKDMFLTFLFKIYCILSPLYLDNIHDE